MKDFFASLYELLKPLYGPDLADHLYGLLPDGTFGGPSLYPTVGLFLFIGTPVGAILYYYGLNKVRYSRWYHWLFALLLIGLVEWFVAFYLPYKDKENGLIAPQIEPNISMSNLVGFGMVNLIYSIALFFLVSILIKRWSRNCSTTPF